MEKTHLTLIYNKKPKKSSRKKTMLVTKEAIQHIENEELTLTNFESTTTSSEFVFAYKKGKKTWDIFFELELIMDTLILDFDGSNLPEEIRMVASKIVEKLTQSLRFKHKDKFWSLSHYFIDNEEEYEKRKQPTYPESFKEDWVRIYNLSKLEGMDEVDQLLFEVEDVHDLELKIVGDDGAILCEYLEKLGLITYEKISKNEYAMEITGTDDDDEIDIIGRKIAFAREIAYYGYNIWVDYAE